MESPWLPAGLRNLGNTCGFNSVFQALSASPVFRRILIRIFHGQKEKAPCGAALADLLWVKEQHEMEEAHRGGMTLGPSEVMRKLFAHQPLFTAGMQHDADEIWHGLIDLLDREERALRTFTAPRSPDLRGYGLACDEAWVKSMTSSIVASCHGLRAQRLVCQECQHSIDRFEPFAALNLTPQPEISDLQGLIDRAVRDVALHDYQCDRCASKKTMMGNRLWRPPPFLWISLKRFSFEDGALQKNRTPVAVAEDMDLSRHILTGGALRYKLRAMVCHIGGLEGGHYFALVRHNQHGWYLTDDEHTQHYPTIHEPALREAAYMLLYERQAQDPVAPKPRDT